ncbi:MAG: prepilin-type N-terminal cleavage/methylation domain-containing protein [Nitrospirota bacterium]
MKTHLLRRLCTLGQGVTGFTLLEVMVAMAILGIAIVAIFQLFSITLRSTKKAEDYTKALFYARALLDESYATQEVSEGTDTVEFEDGFSGIRTMSLNTSTENTRLYEISVKVTWLPSGSLEIKGLRAIPVYESEAE